MSRILVLFDSKHNASAALDELYNVAPDIDVRVHEFPGSGSPGAGGIAPTQNLGADTPGMFVPVTGWFGDVGLNSDETQYFVERMGEDSSLVVVESKDQNDERVHEIAREYNGLVYQDH